MPQKGLTYRFSRVINKIVFPKMVFIAYPQTHRTIQKQTITLVITQQYSHLHSVVNLNIFFLSWVEFAFFPFCRWVVVFASRSNFSLFFLHFHLYLYICVSYASIRSMRYTKSRRMRERILGWAVFVWSIYLVEFKLICYGKQQVGDCSIIIDGNERCFMGNYIRFFAVAVFWENVLYTWLKWIVCSCGWFMVALIIII